MKKILFIAMFVLLASPLTSFASATTTPSNGDPLLVVQAWGLNGYQTPTVIAGTVVYDEAGTADTCPAWYSKNMGCSDLTKTEYYRNQMIKTAKSIIASGLVSQFPQLSYWFLLAK